MVEILYNKKIKDYTFKKEINGIESIKNIPINFKLDDSTSKFRKEILLKNILSKCK